MISKKNESLLRELFNTAYFAAEIDSYYIKLSMPRKLANNIYKELEP